MLGRNTRFNFKMYISNLFDSSKAVKAYKNAFPNSNYVNIEELCLKVHIFIALRHLQNMCKRFLFLFNHR